MPCQTIAGSRRCGRVGLMGGWLWVHGLAGLLVVSGCTRSQDAADPDQPELAANSPATPAGRAANSRQLSPGRLPLYQLQINPADLAALENQSYSNETRPATFIADGQSFPGVKIRVRGSWSRSWPKKSFKIIFEHGHPFHGHHSLNLNSAWHDPAFVREPLAYYIYTACGVPAPNAQLVRLNFNGRFGGVYVEVEQPEKAFLKRVGLAGASVYKASSRGRDADERDLGTEQSYRAGYTKETRKTEGYEELEGFCQDLARCTDVGGFFSRRVQLDRYINYLAATVLIQHWDGFNKNHFLIYDARQSQKWLVVPWDLDRTFGDHWNWSFSETRLPVFLGTSRWPGITGWNRLEDRFFEDPSLRARFLQRLAELLDTVFTEEKLDPVLDKMEADLTPDGDTDRRDWPGSEPNFHRGIQQVRRFIRARRTYLAGELARLQRDLPKLPPQERTL